jgi:pyridoxal phosphate synthase yaaE subunit
MNRIFTVGVVAVQGAFEEHCSALGKLGVSVKEIRSPSDLSPNIDGLISPEEKAPLRENFFGNRDFSI